MASSSGGFSQRNKRSYKSAVLKKKANRQRNLAGCKAKHERKSDVQ